MSRSKSPPCAARMSRRARRSAASRTASSRAARSVLSRPSATASSAPATTSAMRAASGISVSGMAPEVYYGATPGTPARPVASGAMPGSAARARSSRLAARLLPLVLFQEALADADRLRRDLHEFVVGDELDGVLERQRDRRRQRDRLVLPRRADIGQLLALDRVHDQVVVAAVDADHHAF